MAKASAHGPRVSRSGFKILTQAPLYHLHPVGVESFNARFVHIGYGGRKAAHYVRHQTPQGSVLTSRKSEFHSEIGFRCHGSSLTWWPGLNPLRRQTYR